MLQLNYQWFIYIYDSTDKKLWRKYLHEYTPCSMAQAVKDNKYKQQLIVMIEPMPDKYLKAFRKTCSVRVVEDASGLPLSKDWNVVGEVELVRRPNRAVIRLGEYDFMGTLTLPKKKYVYELTYTKGD